MTDYTRPVRDQIAEVPTRPLDYCGVEYGEAQDGECLCSRCCERSLAERDALRATVDRVRALHQRHVRSSELGRMVERCTSCYWEPWPCPTVRALDGATQEAAQTPPHEGDPMTTTDQPAEIRRTKRRYAHELYPHPEEGQTRPLSVEVPYLYARAIGLEVRGTGWMQLSGADSVDRIIERQRAQTIALLADALAQGMTGDEAWTWADQRAGEESGEWVWERAVHHGVDPDQIKPYPCGPDPQHHDHVGPGEIGGRIFEGIVTRADGTEDDCPDCTEPVSS